MVYQSFHEKNQVTVMTEKERVRHDVAEAFDFVRFLISHPKELEKIKDGSEIEILSRDMPRGRSLHRRSGRAQATYISERTFHKV